MINIGTIIKELRENKGYTQTSLAKKLNITRSAVSSWEQGKSIPSDEIKIMIAKLFDVNIEYLFGNNISEINTAYKHNLTTKEKILFEKIIKLNPTEIKAIEKIIDIINEKKKE